MGYIGNQPAETPVVEILETDFKIGEDDQTKIDFADANNINFHADNAKEMVLSANALTPGTSDGTALGTTSLMWSDIFLASGGVMNFNNGNVLYSSIYISKMSWHFFTFEYSAWILALASRT